VTDNQSSNGTHIHLRGPLEIDRSSSTTVRLGRSTVTISLQEQRKAQFDPTTYFLKPNNNSMNGRLTKELEFNQEETDQVLDLLTDTSKSVDRDEVFSASRRQMGYLDDLMISMTPKLSPAHLNCLESIRLANGWQEQKFVDDETNDGASEGGTEAAMSDGDGLGGEVDPDEEGGRARTLYGGDEDAEGHDFEH